MLSKTENMKKNRGGNFDTIFVVYLKYIDNITSKFTFVTFSPLKGKRVSFSSMYSKKICLHCLRVLKAENVYERGYFWHNFKFKAL